MSKSKDIRSFFSVVSKKPVSSAASSTPSKKRAVIVSSDEDVIANSPIVPKKEAKQHKKRKVQVIDSDSDDGAPKIKKTAKKPKVLAPINALDAFGAAPIKQTLINNKKKDDFEKTLIELDDGLDEILDKTIDDALNELNTNIKTSSNNSSIRKVNKIDDLNESGMDPDQERHEKRRHSAVLYQKYLNRSGPAHLGEKELPKGKSDCLKNLCFLRTGVLDSLDRDSFDALIKEHGGRTVSGVSKKVNYLVCGADAGPSKLEKAQNLGIKQINEDELLDLILKRSGMSEKYVKKGDDIEIPTTSQNVVKNEQKSPKNANKKIKTEEFPTKINQNGTKKVIKKEENDEIPAITTKTYAKDAKKNIKKEEEIPAITTKASKSSEDPKNKSKPSKIGASSASGPKLKHPKLTHGQDLAPIAHKPKIISTKNQSWTEKYKPTDIKSIIGQQGERSNVKRLMVWLKNWDKNHLGKNKPKLVRPSTWAKNDDGAYFKCALLSGSPGLGKTTTATLVSQELGFDIVEFNASDTRSKRLLIDEVSQLLSSTSIASFFKDGSAPSKRHVLLMDEVDGMAGNQDRGGMQELINLIKNSSIPIICMCNDRNHQKVKSLANYCLDLRFVKPKIEQIKGAMMSICFKEGIQISSDAMSEIITGAGMDIRQILNNLSMWTSADKTLTALTAQKEANASKKDTILGPWEVIRKVFTHEEHKNMSIADKSRLFFYDYSLGPLFVQENYINVIPHCDKSEILERAALTAESLSMSDLIDTKIRKTNNWALLESQAMFASVIPGHHMSGHIGAQINFPGWLGKNSKRTKFQRLLSELQAHMRTSMSGSKLSVNLDYIYHLRKNIVSPLVKQGTEGVPKALGIMKDYNLLREDLDSIMELSLWGKQKDPMAMVESKVKAALTRAYNKEGPILPYSINAGAVKKRSAAAATSSQESEIFGEEEDEINASDNEEDDDDIGKDAMIKEKKRPATKTKAEAGATKKPTKPRAKKVK